MRAAAMTRRDFTIIGVLLAGVACCLRQVYAGHGFDYVAHIYSIYRFYACLLLKDATPFQSLPGLITLRYLSCRQSNPRAYQAAGLTNA
jgi:hypothetical protein